MDPHSLEPPTTVVQPMSPAPLEGSFRTTASPKPLFDRDPGSAQGRGVFGALVGVSSVASTPPRAQETSQPMLLQQNKALQGLLSRAEEQLHRAQERERQLRLQLENADVSPLFAAQQAQLDALRKDNDQLREQLHDMNLFTLDQQEVARRLQSQVNDTMKDSDHVATRAGMKLLDAEAEVERLKLEIKELRGYEQKARQDCEEVLREKAIMRAQLKEHEDKADERERVIQRLEWTVSDLTRQLESASGDIDLAAQLQERHQKEVVDLRSSLRAEVAELRHLLDGTRAELRESQAAEASARKEIKELDETINAMRQNTVPSQIVSTMENDTKKVKQTLEQEKDSMARKMAALQEDLDQRRLHGDDVGRQLADVTDLWRRTAAEHDVLKSRVRKIEKEASEWQAKAVGALQRCEALQKRNDSLESYKEEYQGMHSRMILMEADALKKKRQADAAAVQVEVMEATVRHAQTEAIVAQQRADEVMRTYVSVSALERAQESAEKLRKEGALERASLKQQLLEAQKALADATQGDSEERKARIAVLEELRKEMIDIDSVIVQAADKGILVADTRIESKVLSPNSDRLEKGRSALLEQQHRHVGVELNRAEEVAMKCERKLELSLMALRAFVAYRAAEAKVLDTEAFSAGITLGNSEVLSSLNVTAADSLSEANGSRDVNGSRAPPALRTLFQALEGGNDDGESVSDLERVLFVEAEGEGSGEGAKDRQIEELKRQLLVIRTNSVPMADYKKAIKVLHAEREKERDSERARQRLTEALRKAQTDAVQFMSRAVDDNKPDLMDDFRSQFDQMNQELDRLNAELLTRGRERDDARRGHMESQARLSASEKERKKLVADLAKADMDRQSLKGAVKAATNAIRKVADQRSEKVEGLEQRVIAGEREKQGLLDRLRDAEERARQAVDLYNQLQARERDVSQQLFEGIKEKETLKTITLELESLQSASVALTQYQELESRLEQAHLEHSRAMLEKSREHDARVGNLEAQIKVRDERIEKLKSELDELQCAMEVARELYESQQSLSAEHSRDQEELSRLRFMCQDLEKSSKELSDRLSEARDELRRRGYQGDLALQKRPSPALIALIPNPRSRPSSPPVTRRSASPARSVGNLPPAPAPQAPQQRVLSQSPVPRITGQQLRAERAAARQGRPARKASIDHADDTLPSFDSSSDSEMTEATDMSEAKSSRARPARGRASPSPSHQSNTAEEQDEDEYVRRSALKNKWWKNKGLR